MGCCAALGLSSFLCAMLEGSLRLSRAGIPVFKITGVFIDRLRSVEGVFDDGYTGRDDERGAKKCTSGGDGGMCNSFRTQWGQNQKAGTSLGSSEGVMQLAW